MLGGLVNSEAWREPRGLTKKEPAKQVTLAKILLLQNVSQKAFTELHTNISKVHVSMLGTEQRKGGGVSALDCSWALIS